MHFGVFDLFKIGIGPSSSHTVGPMKAAARFAESLKEKKVARLRAELYGSLALTGVGHGSDTAILLGLEGADPASLDPDDVLQRLEAIRRDKSLNFAGEGSLPFDEETDLVWHMRERLPFHANGMRFTAYDEMGQELAQDIYYSTGGGFILHDSETGRNEPLAGSLSDKELPYPFESAQDLLDTGEREGLSFADILRANELVFRSEKDLHQGIAHIWNTMHACIRRGLQAEGVLPGSLRVRRRAPQIYQTMQERARQGSQDPLDIMDWVNLWAMAVNEENAAGGRVVTAPTNGAAGIIPSVLRYAVHLGKDQPEDIETFLLTAAAIGALYKKNASISGAEAGCQGEVGVACSMAAAGLAAVMGGTNAQVENAAEIGMEHNLGLTCDPIAGLVQIPCIERNAIASVKAIDAARLALHHDGTHKVSLDDVIKTMHQTGLDMAEKYKETSKGGLAVHVNIVEC